MDLDNPQDLTQEQLMSDELMDEIFSIEDYVERERLLIKLRARAKELKIATAFENVFKACKKSIEQALKEMEQKKAETAVSELPANTSTISMGDEIITANTGTWVVDANGVHGYSRGIPVTASNFPIIVTERCIDRETSKEEVEVVWFRDNARHSIRTAKSVISSSTKIVNLSDYGFPVTSESARYLVMYLADYEKLNPSLIARKSSTSKLGWIGRDFIPYTDSDISFNVPPSFNSLAASIHPNGDPNEWMELMKYLRGTKRNEILSQTAAAFASVLVPIANINPALINLYGGTGLGKTVMLLLLASIWGNPESLIIESTSTTNSMEQRLGVLNNLPAMLDDLSKIQNRGERDRLSELIYMLCSGRGKSRLNKNIELRETSTWSNFILTNMERPLAEDMMQGGAINRVLDFPIDGKQIFENGNSVVKTIKRTYGHAGKWFIETVIEHYDEINQMVDGYITKLKDEAQKTGHEKEQKQLAPMAVILTADELTEKYIFKDGIRLDIAYCVQCMKNVDNVSEMERALSRIEDEVSINRMHYVNDSVDETYRSTIYGYATDKWTAFIKSAFEDIAKRYNFSAKQFLAWADKKGLLMHDIGRMDKKVLIPTIEKRQRCYVLRSTNDDVVYPPPPKSINSEQEELHFD